MAVVVMAAGKGTRMKSPDRAKVMFHVGGIPMVHHVVDLATRCADGPIIVVVGHNREAVREYLVSAFDRRVRFAEQVEQLGTGHAVMQAAPALQRYEGDVLVLSGDVPLLRAETIDALYRVHRESNAVATVLTVTAPDPTGYGRVIRAADGAVEKIVEHRDASPNELRIDEINSGIYLFRAPDLLEALSHLDDNNAQGEYYLTDVFSWFRVNKRRVAAWRTDHFGEIQGINTLEQLRKVDEEFVGRANLRGTT